MVLAKATALEVARFEGSPAANSRNTDRPLCIRKLQNPVKHVVCHFKFTAANDTRSGLMIEGATK